MEESLKTTIQKFLHYSFQDIEYKYEALVPTEKALANKEEFEAMVKWLELSPEVGKFVAKIVG